MPKLNSELVSFVMKSSMFWLGMVEHIPIVKSTILVRGVKLKVRKPDQARGGA